MKLNYQCPICGTPLGYEGLCWKCKSEQDRQSVMNWTAEQIKEKQELLISNIQRLANMEDPELLYSGNYSVIRMPLHRKSKVRH